LREKVIEREKDLVELRRSLQSRLDAIPEIQALKRRRVELVKDVQLLHARERELAAKTKADAP